MRPNILKKLNEMAETKIIEPIEGIEVISGNNKLSEAFKWVIDNSTSNALPYHNLNHLLTVVKYVNNGIENNDIPKDKVDIILLAALFHDVNHSGGKETDDVNVSTAKDAFKTFLETVDWKVDTELVDELLDATQYPYVIEDLSLEQGIIRDADLMQVFEYNWVHQNIYGLAEELNIEFDKFISGQEKFLDSAEFTTEWGKKMKENNWESVLTGFNALKSVYTK